MLLGLESPGCVAPNPRDSTRYHDSARLIDIGTVHLRAGELSDADAAFALADELSGLPAAIDGRGCVAFLRGDDASAERMFLAAYARDRSYTHALGNLALLAEKRGELGRAEALYRYTLTVEPRDFRARTNYAAFLASTKGSTLEGAAVSRHELRKARALFSHPIIEHDLQHRFEEREGRSPRE